MPTTDHVKRSLDEIKRALQHHSARFDRIDGELQAHNARFDRIELLVQKQAVQLDDTRSQVQFTAEALSTLREQMERGFTAVHERMDAGFREFRDLFGKVFVRLDRQGARVDRLEHTLTLFMRGQRAVNRRLSKKRGR